jgi:hypothetical protein
MSKQASTPLDEEQKLPAAMTESEGGLPAHLQDLPDQREGLEESANYQATPMLKVIHPTTLPAILDEFGAGAATINGKLFAGFEEKVKCNVLFFWPSWTYRRDNADKSGHFIIEESLDSHSELAAKCRNPKMREVPYEDNPKMFYNHAEQLNFLMQTEVESNDVPKGTIFTVAWAMGGHKVGKRFNSYADTTGCPIYCNVIDLEVTKSRNTQNEWYQLDFSLDEEKVKRFITQEQLIVCKDAHVRLKAAHAAKLEAERSNGSESDGSGD